MLINAARLDVMHRLGRAMADPTRSRILLTLLEGPEYPAVLARDLGPVSYTHLTLPTTPYV